MNHNSKCIHYIIARLYYLLDSKGTIVPFLSRLCFAQLLLLWVLPYTHTDTHTDTHNYINRCHLIMLHPCEKI